MKFPAYRKDSIGAFSVCMASEGFLAQDIRLAIMYQFGECWSNNIINFVTTSIDRRKFLANNARATAGVQAATGQSLPLLTKSTPDRKEVDDYSEAAKAI